MLFNYRLSNYKIKIEGNARPEDLGYSLLYKIIIDKLEVYKKYINKALAKGFIENNSTL